MVFPALTKGEKYNNAEKRNMLESTMAYFHLCRSGHSIRIESGKRAAEKSFHQSFFSKIKPSVPTTDREWRSTKKGLSRGLYTFRGEGGGHFFSSAPVCTVSHPPMISLPSPAAETSISISPSFTWILFALSINSIFWNPFSPLAAR